MNNDKESNNLSPFKPNDHLANERTYLAWVRTGIGIMAFGFVVVKFSLFVKQIGFVLKTKVSTPSHGYSSIIGIILVTLGTLSILFAFCSTAGLKSNSEPENTNLLHYLPQY